MYIAAVYNRSFLFLEFSHTHPSIGATQDMHEFVSCHRVTSEIMLKTADLKHLILGCVLMHISTLSDKITDWSKPKVFADDKKICGL